MDPVGGRRFTASPRSINQFMRLTALRTAYLLHVHGRVRLLECYVIYSYSYIVYVAMRA
jgi:hypothetical protein